MSAIDILTLIIMLTIMVFYLIERVHYKKLITRSNKKVENSITYFDSLIMQEKINSKKREDREVDCINR